MKRFVTLALSALLLFALAGCASTGPTCCAACGKDHAAQQTCEKAKTPCSVKACEKPSAAKPCGTPATKPCEKK